MSRSSNNTFQKIVFKDTLDRQGAPVDSVIRSCFRYVSRPTTDCANRLLQESIKRFHIYARTFKYLFNSINEAPCLFFGCLSPEFRARWGKQAANTGKRDRHPVCGINSSSLICWHASVSSMSTLLNAAAILKLWSDALGRTIGRGN
jgi:hypothetical protein